MVTNDGAARTILIVDDNVDLTHLLRKYLAREGFKVVIFADGTEALGWLGENRTDLVLLDLGAPGEGSGRGLIDRLCERGREIPFIVVTAHGGERRAVEMMKRGALDYVMKDATLLQLLPTVVDQALIHLERQRKLKEAEFALQNLRAHYELILNAVGEGVCGLDLEGRLTFVNPAGLRALGYEAAELIGQDLAILADRPGADQPGMKQNVAANSTFRSHDQLFWRKDGSSFPIEYTSTPIRSGGRQVGTVFVFRDISKKRALEAQVAQWQRLEAVGRLAGAIAHDFNNLLTVISGYTDLLSAQPTMGDRDRIMVSEIRDATERAITLTRQLLAFGQKQELRPRSITLSRFFAEIKPILQRILGPNVAINDTINSTAGPCLADPDHLEQVFVNLAINAKESMPDGGRLSVTAENIALPSADDRTPTHLRAGSYVLITVTDTGARSPLWDSDHIFEPILATKDKRHSLGMGLAAVYGIMQQTGGHIEVTEDSQGGTTFRLYLPRAGREAGATAAEPVAKMQGDETVLVVQDNAALRTLAVQILRDHGYRVVEAERADEGERIFCTTNGGVDLVVADDAPGSGGGGLVDRLRLHKPEVTAILLSDYRNGHPAADRRDGRSMVLEKPFTAESLIRAVRAALDQFSSALR